MALDRRRWGLVSCPRPCTGPQRAPCRVEGRRGECEEALSPNRPSSGGNPYRREVVSANTTSAHGHACSQAAREPLHTSQRITGHGGGASVAVRRCQAVTWRQP